MGDMTVRIGSIELDRPLALAPMEDVTDLPFRRICKERGADLVFTEFVSCEALIRDVPRSVSKMAVEDSERPVGIQLYGSAEGSLERAAAIAEAAEPDFIDINCGCWVKKIAMRGDGAGLLRDLGKFEGVVRSVIRGTSLPVTVKTRLGWDGDSIVILEVARMLEQAGVAMLAVHCRTRKQAYGGEADWSWLPRIKEVSALPLVANGDIVRPEDVASVFDLGADGAMIGRGAIENPWIFEQTKHYLATGEHLAAPGIEERIELCIRHLKENVAHRGEHRGVTTFRKFYGNYLKGMHGGAKLRAGLMAYMEVPPIEEALRGFAEGFRAGAMA